MSISSARSKRFCANFRIVSSGPESDSGGMIAFTRDPSGRRASTSGDDSSIRRPICPTIFVMIRRRCDVSRERQRRLREPAVALDPDVVRAVDHDLRDRRIGEQPLERAVAEDVVGDLGCEPPRGRRATGPSPGRVVRRSRTRRARGRRRCPRRRRAAARARSTSARWIRFFSSANGSAALPVPSRSCRRCRSASSRFARGVPLLARLPQRHAAAARCRSAHGSTGTSVRDVARYRSASAAYDRAAFDFGSATTIGWPLVSARGIARSLPTSTSGARPRSCSTSDCVMPTFESARLSTSVTAFGS